MDIIIAAKETIKLIREDKTTNWPKEGPLSITHVRDHMLPSIIDGRITDEQAHRWLGWAQCAIVNAGCASLEELKLVNKKA